MKRLLVFLAFCFFCGTQAQQIQTADFYYETIALEELLPKIEQAFDIQYSYLDRVVAPHRVKLPSQKYTLSEINAAIQLQTGLKIAQLDGRYFSVYHQAEPLQIQWLQEILVENLLAKGIDKKTSTVALSPQKIEILPGVTDADILLSLQQLPGVKSPNETATGLHIRGGTPDQNLILWDGIRMYHPGHLFGMISGFNPNVRQTVHYYNKATDARFGERVSGTIDIKTQDKIAKKTIVDAGFNGLNADVCLQLPLVKDQLDLQVSGRKSYTQWWPSPTFDALAEKVFQHTEFSHFDDVNRFAFEDYSAKINFKPFGQTAIGLSGILIDNALDFTAGSGANIVGQQLDIRNLGYSVSWEQKYGKRFKQRLLWQYSAYRFDYFKKRDFASADYESFEKKNRVTDSGLSADFNYEFSEKLRWSFGYQLSGNDLSHAFTADNEGFSVDLGQRQAYAKIHTVYLQGDFAWGKWQFLGGVRASRYAQSVHAIEPRLLIQRKMGRLVWQSSYERKSQVVGQVRESISNDLSLENYVWVLAGEGQYPVQYANQFTTGILFKENGWLLDADAYYKTIKGITAYHFGTMQYNTAAVRGEGSTKGFDLLLQKNLSDWRAWLTYTFQDSQNEFESVNNGRVFPTSTDITHAASLSVFRKWQRFSATAGWFWHSGKPFSRLDAQGQVIAFNADRLPAYHRLDVSALYVFRKTQKCTAKVGASVTNLYNRRAVISKEYERSFASFSDLSNSRYAVQDYYSLGLLPNIFVRVSF